MTSLTREQWLDHLREGSGPLHPEELPDRLGELRGDEELATLLRDLLRPPWPEDAEHPADPYLPVIALELLGLLAAEEALDEALEALHEADELFWDWLLESWPYAVAMMGPAAFAAVKERLLVLESSFDPEARYYYWALLAGLMKLAWSKPELRDAFVKMGSARLGDPGFPLELAELWLDKNIELRAPELSEFAPAFFERARQESGEDEAYFSEIFGDLQDYQNFFDKPPRMREEPRDYLLQDYRRLRERVEEERKPKPKPKIKRPLDEHLILASADGGPLRAAPKVGRNQPCPCGSGKKYKHCCGSPKKARG